MTDLANEAIISVLIKACDDAANRGTLTDAEWDERLRTLADSIVENYIEPCGFVRDLLAAFEAAVNIVGAVNRCNDRVAAARVKLFELACRSPKPTRIGLEDWHAGESPYAVSSSENPGRGEADRGSYIGLKRR